MFRALRFGSGLLRGPCTRDMHAGEKPPGFRYTARRWGAQFLTGAAGDHGCRCLTIFTTAGPASLTCGEAMRNREETAALLSSQRGLRAQVPACACPEPAALPKPPLPKVELAGPRETRRAESCDGHSRTSIFKKFSQTVLFLPR